MKTKLNQTLSLTTLLIVVMFSFATCKKDSTPAVNNTTNPVVPSVTYYFSCKINGVFKDFKNQTLIKDNPANVQEIFLVAGVTSGNTPPIFNFDLNKKGLWEAGLSYKLDDNDLANFATYKDENLDEFKSTAISSSNNGGLTISFTSFNLTKDSAVSGTFSGSLQLEQTVKTVVITEGKFKVKFQN
ncbi:MAG: hypothetical protein H7296_03320 [Bacteroidia bacterium]|nr:hypothetical protein [Bacteroidia bacterium]